MDEKIMKKEVGLWIDHRKTVPVFVTDEGEETRKINQIAEKVRQKFHVEKNTSRQS